MLLGIYPKCCFYSCYLLDFLMCRFPKDVLIDLHLIPLCNHTFSELVHSICFNVYLWFHVSTYFWDILPLLDCANIRLSETDQKLNSTFPWFLCLFSAKTGFFFKPLFWWLLLFFFHYSSVKALVSLFSLLVLQKFISFFSPNCLYYLSFH